MTKVNILADSEALRVLIGQNGGTSCFGLSNDIRSSRVIQETVVDAAGIPCIDTLGSAE
jgi:hypothetical protein